MPDNDSIVSSFIEDTPPGQLDNVFGDIKTLLGIQTSEASKRYYPAFRKYNEQHTTTVKLPGSSEEVIVSEYNALGDDRYFDTASHTSFTFDHVTRQASATQTHVVESEHADLIESLSKSLSAHAAEHYPSASTGVYPVDGDIVLLVVANKYSLNNFWSGRWTGVYRFSPATSDLNGAIRLDVHYFEDGNVRLRTDKQIASRPGSTAADVVRSIAVAERKYQDHLNRAFPMLNEDAFKNLRRQLPVTRQKVDWDKIGGYRLGQDIAGQTK